MHAEGALLQAQVLPPETAVAAALAVDVRLDGDQVALVHPGDAAAQGVDDPGDLVPEDHRPGGRHLPAQHVGVRAAQADGAWPDPNLAGPGLRNRQILQAQVPGAVELQCLHDSNRAHHTRRLLISSTGFQGGAGDRGICVGLTPAAELPRAASRLAQTGSGVEAKRSVEPSPQPSKVVCIGSSTYDYIAVVEGAIAPDVRLPARDMLQGFGGPSANAAVTLARLGVPVSFVGGLGDDEQGRSIRDGLEREGVEISGLRVVPGDRSASSVIVIDGATGRRAIAAFAGATLAPMLQREDLDRCAAAEWVHVDQAGYPVLETLRREGIRTPVSLDAGNPVPGLDLAAIALYSPTESALQAAFDTGDTREALRRALAAGARTVVVTRGAEGSLAAEASAEGVRFSSAPVPDVGEVVSTLGAGDVFHGALLAALTGGRGIREALHYANATAALSCRALDGRTGIPGAAEVEALLARLPPAD